MYYLVYGFLYVLSLLPLRILYFISDGIYLLLYYVIGYRKKVVKNNLQIAFPEKTVEERLRIEKQFYRNFVDNFIETLKLFSGKEKFALKHFHTDPALMQEIYARGLKCQFHLGDNFNWELANIAVSAMSPLVFLGVYMPIKNKVFDRIFRKMRSSVGTVLLPATDMKAAMIPYRNTQYLLGLVADQVPGDVSRAYWMNFFGKATPFARGPERGARAANLAVVFAQIYKTKRGQYHLQYELCTDQPAGMEPGELTYQYVKYLEKGLREHPEMWLWSHRRWKKDWKEEYRDLWIDSEEPK